MELKAKQDEDALFEGLLEHVGTDGKFQKRFNLLFNMGFIFTVAMPTFNIILAVTLPSHWCYVPGREHSNVTLEEWKSITLPRSNKTGEDAGEPYSKCEMYDIALPLNLSAVNETELNITSCRYGWEYDTTWYSVTAPSQEDWVCEKELYVPNALLFSRIGEVVGTLIFGQLGDTIGRRPTLFLAVATLVFGRVLTAYTASIYWMFLLANIIGSLPCAAVFQSPLIIGMEVSSAEQRALIAMLQCVGWTAGMCVMPMIAWLTGGNWKIFMVLTSLPCALVFVVHRMFPESPRWLAARGKSKKCIRVLNHIAQLNGTHVPEDSYALLQKMAGRKEKIYGVASLFSNWRLVRNTLLISVSLLLTQIMYYTMVLNVASMSGNPFLNFLLQAMVELPGFLFGRWLCDIVGRRWCQAGSFFVAAVVQFGVIGTVTRADMYTVLVVLVLIVKFCVTVAAYCAYLQCMELYPTCLRQTGTSVGFLAANGLGAIAPYIVYLGTITDLRYPYVILTCMSFLGVICASLLPETLHQKLPETVQEASQFGVNQKFWSLPKAAPKHYEKANTKEPNDHSVIQNHKC